MQTEKIILGANTKYPLNGILTLPDQTGVSFPAVVFVHGSGASNMDEKVGRLTPFKDLAEGLASHGIASLRYDKRSFAHGLKMLKEKECCTVKEETITDALLATELLRMDSRIDPKKIFLIGHSMGGMLAPRIDAEGGDYCGLVLLAGSPRTLEEIMLEQTSEVLPQVSKLLQWILKKQIRKLSATFASISSMSDEDAKKTKVGNGVTLYYFKEMSRYPVSGYLKNLQKPILILQGEKDFQVKADKDFTRYQQLLEGKSNASFKLYPNLNHAFVPSVYGSISKAKHEYNVEQHIGEEVISDIAAWILCAAGNA